MRLSKPILASAVAMTTVAAAAGVIVANATTAGPRPPYRPMCSPRISRRSTATPFRDSPVSPVTNS